MACAPATLCRGGLGVGNGSAWSSGRGGQPECLGATVAAGHREPVPGDRHVHDGVADVDDGHQRRLVEHGQPLGFPFGHHHRPSCPLGDQVTNG
jgi:hypothetical protein